ncbi:MAG: DUF934 domain-containing protein [Pseudomonadota bacterium]
MPDLIKRNSLTGEWEAHTRPEPTISWLPGEQWTAGESLLLQNADEPQPAHAQASAIAVNFPGLNDGLGLSLGVLLRTRIQFTGELRAVGEVHADALHHMARCGFDAFEISPSADLHRALRLIAPFSNHYQNSMSNPAPSYRRVQSR